MEGVEIFADDGFAGEWDVVGGGDQVEIDAAHYDDGFAHFCFAPPGSHGAEKQIPLCVPRPPNCGGKENARDCVRDDDLRVGLRRARHTVPFAPTKRHVAAGGMPRAEKSAKQRLARSMKPNRPLQMQKQSQRRSSRKGGMGATKAKPPGYACGSAATGMYIGAGGGVQAGSGTRFAW